MKQVHTKIICTLGPSSSSVTTLRKMIMAGMDVIRLNFSHSTHEEHLKKMCLIRQLNKKYRRRIRILQDLEGFRIRVGRLDGFPHRKVELLKNKLIVMSNRTETTHAKAIPFDYEGPLSDIKPGQDIFIDDGNIHLRVHSVTRKYLKAVVIVPGMITENKGINLPGVKLHFKGLSDKDKADLNFGLDQGVDFVAQSFVRNKQDALNIKKVIDQRKASCQLIAKIENREGLQHLDRILDVVDGIMIARGDLGVSLPIYQIPVFQKLIIKQCQKRKKFVITATQMLESMTERLRPSRAEVTDVANAIIDGSDYTMLSGETAAGQHPVESVAMMNDVCRFTEDYLRGDVRI